MRAPICQSGAMTTWRRSRAGRRHRWRTSCREWHRSRCSAELRALPPLIHSSLPRMATLGATHGSNISIRPSSRKPIWRGFVLSRTACARKQSRHSALPGSQGAGDGRPATTRTGRAGDGGGHAALFEPEPAIPARRIEVARSIDVVDTSFISTFLQTFMSKEAMFTMKLEPELRDAFMAEAEASHRPASQVVRELTREFIERQRQAREYDSFLRAKVDMARAQIASGHYASDADVEVRFAARRAALRCGPRPAALTHQGPVDPFRQARPRPHLRPHRPRQPAWPTSA